ncbi:MAG: DNA primase catalytic subunit PriS, partial [Candidatus Micrarchaeota archaeon]
PNPHQWLCDKFGQYYARAHPWVPRGEKREFGFGGWEKKIEFRHLSFANEQELAARLAREKPLYVSVSSAYYEFPAGRPMAKKNWLGADLVFDLDAEAHSCAPFTCTECFDKIKANAIALVEDFLLPDFGLSREELQVSFSGSRGYHVRAYKKELEPLGREERREVVDYIEGNGLDFESFFSNEEVSGGAGEHGKPSKYEKLLGPTPQDGGHKGKFARDILKLVKDAKTAGQVGAKLKDPVQAARFIKGIEAGRWSDVRLVQPKARFRELFERLRLHLSEKVETDANVTIDTSKILRLPDSVHGGSAMVAKTIKGASALSDFVPSRDAVFLSHAQTEKVRTSRAVPSILWADASTEPLEAEKTVELSESFAAYLVAKKAAVPLG